MKILAKTSDDLQVAGEDIECLLWQSGYLLSAGSSKGNIRVWKGDLKLVCEFKAHDYPVYHMTAGQKSNLFYTGSSDSTIRLWEIDDNGECNLLKTLEGHKDAIRRLRISGNRLYSADETGEIKVWENDQEICSWNMGEEVWDMIVTDSLIYTVRDRDISCNEITQRGENKMRLSNRNSLPGRGPINITDNKLSFVERSGMEIEIHDATSSGNPLLGKLTGHSAIINAVAVDKNVLFSSGWDKQVISWDLNDLKLKEKVEVPGYVNTSAVHTNGTLFVAGENSFITLIGN